MNVPRVSSFYFLWSLLFILLNITSLFNAHDSLHPHSHHSVDERSSREKPYYTNIMEIIKGSDLLSPTDSIRTLAQNYDDYDTSYNEVWSNDDEGMYDHAGIQTSSDSSPRFWKKFITHLIKDHMMEKREGMPVTIKTDHLNDRHVALDPMNPDFMVTGFFVVSLGIFTTIAILSHDARLTELESNQASICSATRTFGNLVLPEATTATTASINVAINAINNFATPSC